MYVNSGCLDATVKSCVEKDRPENPSSRYCSQNKLLLASFHSGNFNTLIQVTQQKILEDVLSLPSREIN